MEEKSLESLRWWNELSDAEKAYWASQMPSLADSHVSPLEALLALWTLKCGQEKAIINSINWPERCE